ncbi:MAG TPA: hypothetical protein VLO11_15380 [Luteolibacter sp.]|nr:hypothetical protein [Luteolibacter sp.]
MKIIPWLFALRLPLFADDLGHQASAYADPAAPSANDVIRTPMFERIAIWVFMAVRTSPA